MVMLGDGILFIKKKLITKTVLRYRSEHSMMCGYSYALTALTMHYFTGPLPSWMSSLKFNKLSMLTNKTLDMMIHTFVLDEICPANPNLVLSTDDTTFFVFEEKPEGSNGDEWEWKLIDKSNNNSSVRGVFEVEDDAGNSRFFCVHLTFTFTAIGLFVPLYVSVSCLTVDGLLINSFSDGIFSAKVPGLYKEGDNLFNNSFGWLWLVFLWAYKRDTTVDRDPPSLSIANTKFIHYTSDVLLPFIQSIREALGWKPSQTITEWLTTISWFDGDITQLQTVLFEAREALDNDGNIICNKDLAATTGTPQPCDFSLVFRLLKALQKQTMVTNNTAIGLERIINDLFAYQLCAGGLNLESNLQKKKSLIYFPQCMPEMLEQTTNKDHLKKPFVEAGMTDEENKVFHIFDRLIGTCKRCVSSLKHIGMSWAIKKHHKDQFPQLAQIHQEVGQVLYANMYFVGVP